MEVNRWNGGIALSVIVIVLSLAWIAHSLTPTEKAALPPEAVPKERVPGHCGPMWIVRLGDTTEGIIRHCFPGEHIGKVKEEIRALNPHIPDLGRIFPRQEMRLPGRGPSHGE